MSSKARKKQADFCVKPCQLDDVFLFSSLSSRCSYICPLYALEHGLTVSKHGDSLHCPQKQSACLHTVLLGHPLRLPSAGKPQPRFNPPSLSGRLRAEVRPWGARGVCIFTGKCRSVVSHKISQRGRRREHGFPSAEAYGQVTNCSRIQTQELRPPQTEQKRLRKGLRGCWVDRNGAALIQPAFHTSHPPQRCPCQKWEGELKTQGD